MAGFGCCTGKSSFGDGRPKRFGKTENEDTCVAAYTIEGLITAVEGGRRTIGKGVTTATDPWFNLETTITRKVKCLTEGKPPPGDPAGKPLVSCQFGGAMGANISTDCSDDGPGLADDLLRVEIIQCGSQQPVGPFGGGPGSTALLNPDTTCAKFTTKYCEVITDCDCKKKLRNSSWMRQEGCNLVKEINYGAIVPSNSPAFGKHPLVIKWWNQYVGPRRHKFSGGEQSVQYLHGVGLDILRLVEDALPNNIVPPKYCCTPIGSFGLQH